MLPQEHSITGAILGRLPGVVAIYLYGSRVSGRTHPGSDTDIALLMPHGADWNEMDLCQLQAELESTTGCPVDLSVLRPDKFLVHCMEVITQGRKLYLNDESAVSWFEMKALSDYVRLCEDKAPVVKAYSLQASA